MSSFGSDFAIGASLCEIPSLLSAKYVFYNKGNKSFCLLILRITFKKLIGFIFTFKSKLL